LEEEMRVHFDAGTELRSPYPIDGRQSVNTRVQLLDNVVLGLRTDLDSATADPALVQDPQMSFQD